MEVLILGFPIGRIGLTFDTARARISTANLPQVMPQSFVNLLLVLHQQLLQLPQLLFSILPGNGLEASEPGTSPGHNLTGAAHI